MKKILIVGAQHGNELLGEQLYAFIQKQPNDAALEVGYVLANPKARRQNVRFIASDMNRSFARAGTYEATRAAELLIYIKDNDFDIVLDAHTTTVAQPPCLIVHGIVADNCTFLRASHIKKIVVMKHELVAHSLIGHVPQAISVEVSNSDLGPQLFQKLSDDLVDFAHGRARHRHKQVFVVSELLRRTMLPSAEISKLRNFTRTRFGFYPVLVGEKAYAEHTDYLGFIAQTKQEVIV